jgi:hypothetical protein
MCRISSIGAATPSAPQSGISRAVGIVLDSTVLIAAERTHQNARERFLNELLNEIWVEPITLPIAFRAGQEFQILLMRQLRKERMEVSS